MAKCVFVNLEHRLYRPNKVMAPLFLPGIPEEEPLEYVDQSLGSRVVIDENTVFLEDLM